MKKGITLVTLTITIVILAVLAGTAFLMITGEKGLFVTTQTTVDLVNKQTVIEEIKLQIEKKRILTLEQGKELDLQKDIVPILEKFGTYNEEKFELTIEEENIQIELGELIILGAKDLIDAEYTNQELIVTEKVNLAQNGYSVEYSIDNGQTWQEYKGTTTIENAEVIYVRVVDSEGNAIGEAIKISNRLKTIYVSTPPNKTIYDRGELFNPEGMEVTAIYHNGARKVVTDYTYSPKGELTISDSQIVISYTEEGITKTATTPITMIKELKTIAIKEFNKTKYKQGETINKEDIKIVALYEDNSIKEITDFTYEPSGELMSTDEEVVISYTEYGTTKTVTQKITVTYVNVIEITSEPLKTAYIKGETFDPTGMIVSAIYSDGSALEITEYTYSPTGALTTSDTSIIVTYEGKTAVVAITVEGGGINEEGNTLGSIIESGMAYGTPVTGYTAGLTGYEVSDWSVFYEDTTNGYVYLIASNVLTEAQIPTITGATKGAYTGYGILRWSSAPAVQTMSSNSIFKAEWSNYATNTNGKCVSALLNTNNWIVFATPSDTTIQDYVVGAIGSPTAEMFAASWSEKNTSTPLTMTNKNSSGTESTNGYYYNYDGSIAQYHDPLTKTGNELYFPEYNGNKAHYWLASPSAYNASNLCGVLGGGGVNRRDCSDAYRGVRPVVCLKSDIPATVTANGIDI